MNKGERITPDMVNQQLNLEKVEVGNNLVPVNEESDKIERELILKQLLFLRQDINEIKLYLLSSSSESEIIKTNPALFLPIDKNKSKTVSVGNDIKDAQLRAIKDDVVGEITMSEIEREVIERYLKQFKGNRRKTAKALDISERTLYRKIKEYDLQV